MKQCMKLTLIVFLLLPALALAAAPGGGPDDKIDLNRASIQQLDSLPGVGPATARRIIDFRLRKGPFKRKEELMAVPGIGERRFARIKDRITVAVPRP
ncbi:MAG: ComEA family DNA-binding protein [Acidobacteriota bacterium]